MSTELTTPPAPDLSQIALVGFRFVECAIREEGDPYPAVTAADSVSSFHVATTVEFNPAHQRFNVLFAIRLEVRSAAGVLLVQGQLQLRFSYRVENLAEQLTMVEGQPHPIPSARLALTLVGTSYSTARGLILAKLANTALEGFSMPLADARTLLSGMGTEASSAAGLPAPAKARRGRKPRTT